jgi:hypothetical protein
MCRAGVAIDSYEGPGGKSESVIARYPDIVLSDLRSTITTSRKSGKNEKPVLEFRFCNKSSFLLPHGPFTVKIRGIGDSTQRPLIFVAFESFVARPQGRLR